MRFLYGDPSGVVRGKQVHIARLPDALASGLGLTRAQNALNLLDDLVPVDGMEPVGEIRIVPDPATFTRLPWLDGVASMLCDQVDHDGGDWGGCPRAFLRRAVDAAAQAGLRVEAASASARVIEISCWPGPYSLMACSTWMPWASSASTMSFTTAAARSSPAEE